MTREYGKLIYANCEGLVQTVLLSAIEDLEVGDLWGDKYIVVAESLNDDHSVTIDWR